MYDIKQRQPLSDIPVSYLIELLRSTPPEATLTVNGDDYFYIHVESDGSVVNIDNEPLDECYGD